jgi:hypothetical protein
MRVKPKKKRVKAPTPEPRPFRLEDWRHLLAAAALALLTFLAFANSFSAGFVLDNKGLLLQDPRLRELTVENIRLIFQHTYWWPTGEAGLYRPFTTLSFLFNYAVLGNAQEPAGYHWINFFLHLGNVFLVYALARRLLRSDYASPDCAGSDSPGPDRAGSNCPGSDRPGSDCAEQSSANPKPQSIPALRIAQSEALRIDSRESTAKLRPQSFALSL